jgi:UDP-N-acetylglucosamine transferase subunit ALG13
MIFVTVGTQLPFDRLIRSMDGWAKATHANVFAQVGPASSYKPEYIRTRADMSPEEFDEAMDEAHIIVAHAGMGTILSGLERGKPVIIMPRRAIHGEHRNDHQLATAAKLAHLGGLHVAEDEQALLRLLSDLALLKNGPALASAASQGLITAIREFISP